MYKKKDINNLENLFLGGLGLLILAPIVGDIGEKGTTILENYQSIEAFNIIPETAGVYGMFFSLGNIAEPIFYLTGVALMGYSIYSLYSERQKQ